MKTTPMIVLAAAGALLAVSCGPEPAPTPPVTQETTVTTTTSVSETAQAVLGAVNAARHNAGLPTLTGSAELVALARSDSDAVAAANGSPVTGAQYVPRKGGFMKVGKMRGVLKDRGPKTGQVFVDYWAKDRRDVLFGNASHVGVAVSKTADGRLVAVVITGSM